MIIATQQMEKLLLQMVYLQWIHGRSAHFELRGRLKKHGRLKT